MKYTKYLLIPTLFMLTSCITHNPSGPIYDPDLGGSESQEEIVYYQDGSKGDDLTGKSLTNPVAVLFDNDLQTTVGGRFENDEAIKTDPTVKDESNFITSYESENVLKGYFGISLIYQPGSKNKLTFNLSAPKRFIKITCAPSFQNSFDYESNKETFVTKESAIRVQCLDEYKSNYVKLVPGEKIFDANNECNRNPMQEITFDLQKDVSSFTLNSINYSTAIYKIELFNEGA